MRTIVLRCKNHLWTIETLTGSFISSRRWVYRNQAEDWANSVLEDMLTSYCLEVIIDEPGTDDSGESEPKPP